MCVVSEIYIVQNNRILITQLFPTNTSFKQNRILHSSIDNTSVETRLFFTTRIVFCRGGHLRF